MTISINAPYNGVVKTILARQGAIVKTGDCLCAIERSE